jgi:predicted nucleic acid-binding protein
MTRVVVDASVLAAIAFGEPRRDALAARLAGAIVCAPRLLELELANVAWKKLRRHPDQAGSILRALSEILSPKTGVHWHDVPAIDAAIVAAALGCTAYDAAYVWLAGSLGADLITEDPRLAQLTAAGSI